MMHKQAAFEKAQAEYMASIRRYSEMVGRSRSTAKRSAAWVACRCGELQLAMFTAEADLGRCAAS
jgi:hypothetical protein